MQQRGGTNPTHLITSKRQNSSKQSINLSRSVGGNGNDIDPHEEVSCSGLILDWAHLEQEHTALICSLQNENNTQITLFLLSSTVLPVLVPPFFRIMTEVVSFYKRCKKCILRIMELQIPLWVASQGSYSRYASILLQSHSGFWTLFWKGDFIVIVSEGGPMTLYRLLGCDFVIFGFSTGSNAHALCGGLLT